jgi:hypothetical protein
VTRRVVTTWRIRDGGSLNVGNVSADGKVLWLCGRYSLGTPATCAELP